MESVSKWVNCKPPSIWKLPFGTVTELSVWSGRSVTSYWAKVKPGVKKAMVNNNIDTLKKFIFRISI